MNISLFAKTLQKGVTWFVILYIQKKLAVDEKKLPDDPDVIYQRVLVKHLTQHSFGKITPAEGKTKSLSVCCQDAARCAVNEQWSLRSEFFEKEYFHAIFLTATWI